MAFTITKQRNSYKQKLVFRKVQTEFGSPPVRNGKLSSSDFTDYGKKKILEAANYIQWFALKQTRQKFKGAFLTLTYAENKQDFADSKRELNIFLTRLRKRYPRIKYAWVVERQKRGAIHYHLLLSHYVHASYISKFWKHGRHEIKMVRKSARGYMACYLGKSTDEIEGNRYGFSNSVSKDLKYEVINMVNFNEFNRQLESILNESGVFFNMEYCSWSVGYINSKFRLKQDAVFDTFDSLILN